MKSNLPETTFIYNNYFFRAWCINGVNTWIGIAHEDLEEQKKLIAKNIADRPERYKIVQGLPDIL